ncbi:CUB domain-containing protein 1a isoform X1 [Astyanax mexicanus]|uniref:CUB domain-containing protein 1a isoform X1 n=1 Tax=Astyanax mexicanus TaxID=7994 RepID=UPI0020CB0A0D|nr:CUB domain-containing protein 1a isoform X1 [Astyanax mexicanus]
MLWSLTHILLYFRKCRCFMLKPVFFFFTLICLKFFFLFYSGGLVLTVHVHSGATVLINRTQTAVSKCEVCIGKSCQSSVTLQNSADVEFNCTEPENLFTVEIVRYIVCTESCDRNITPEQYPSLQNFSRTFTWIINGSDENSFSLDFTKTGLRQIRATESCPDKHVYTVSNSTTSIGRFCRNGTIKGMEMNFESSVSLQVPGQEQLEPTTFGVSVGNGITVLAMIKVSLPAEESSQEFFSPNYPGNFADFNSVRWSFNVPPKYYASVRILDFTEPRCLRDDTHLKYERDGKTVVKKLSDAQLSEHQGSFNLTFRSCLRRNLNSVLSLHFNISAIKRGAEACCTVDLTREEGLLELHIRKSKPTSACILKLSSLIQDTVTVTSEKALTLAFIDCREEDLLLNINQTIACQQQKGCVSSKFSLRVPVLEKCLPGFLQQVSWHLNTPQDGAVELMSPTGSLQQSLPGQTCNSSILLTVTEHEQQGMAVGQFCPQGPIRSVQIQSNITVTASHADGRDLKLITYPLLEGSFLESLKERYIINVMPKKDSSVLLATPAWPAGMKPQSTVSWIVSFPSQFEANVEFTNISQVSCANRHTSIEVQKQSSRGETYSWRMDEKPKSVVMEESFYLNMSNCKSVKGSFSVVSQITLLKRKNKSLTIALSVVSVLLLLVVIAFAVVCVINRRKKKQQNSHPEVSVYNPNGHAFLPVPKTTEDDEHIYHCIDDTMVYGHLLKHGEEVNDFEPAVDSYQAFTGPTEVQPLTEHRENTDKIQEVGVYRPFTGPQNAPEVPERSPRQGRNPAHAEQQGADKKISGDDKIVEDQVRTTPGLKIAPLADPEEDDSETPL